MRPCPEQEVGNRRDLAAWVSDEATDQERQAKGPQSDLAEDVNLGKEYRCQRGDAENDPKKPPEEQWSLHSCPRRYAAAEPIA